jgi:uncharacterized membrane protein YdjX (TVP38/TMEM64 family)
MRSKKGKIVLVLLVVAVMCGLWVSGLHEAVNLERIKEERDVLHAFVQENYLLSVLFFLLLTVSTAFLVPGAIVLMLAGGFFFGVVPGLLFAVTGLTLGAVTAFLAARYVLGGWVQERYKVLFASFNEEMHRHGHYYLITLRVVPVLPFFLVNILAGLTKISLKRFIASTSIGLVPASFVYSFAGRRLAVINSPRDILSPGMIAALFLLGGFILLPVILKSIDRMRKKSRT